MPEKIRRAFEREYGKSTGDKYFYGWENKHGFRREQLENHPKMSKSWMIQEAREHHSTPFSPKWLNQEKSEHNHPSLHLNHVNWNKWIKEERKEARHR